MSNPVSSHRKVILAMTGASGAILGVRALHLLQQAGVETHLVISKAARFTIEQETEDTVTSLQKLASFSYSHNDLTAPLASGSFRTDGMLVVPCSIKTLSSIAHSYNVDLITRAADVCLKEGRPLLLAVRETPLHPGHLRLMRQASSAGAIIFPPIPFFYGRPKTIEELIDSLVGRMLLRIGIDTPTYPHWTGGDFDNTTGTLEK